VVINIVQTGVNVGMRLEVGGVRRFNVGCGWRIRHWPILARPVGMARLFRMAIEQKLLGQISESQLTLCRVMTFRGSNGSGHPDPGKVICVGLNYDSIGARRTTSRRRSRRPCSSASQIPRQHTTRQ